MCGLCRAIFTSKVGMELYKATIPFMGGIPGTVQVAFGEAICPYLIYLDTWLKYGQKSNHIGRKGATRGIYRWYLSCIHRCHTWNNPIEIVRGFPDAGETSYDDPTWYLSIIKPSETNHWKLKDTPLKSNMIMSIINNNNNNNINNNININIIIQTKSKHTSCEFPC